MEQYMEFAGRHPLLVGGFVVVFLLLIWIEITRRFQRFQEVTPVQAVPMINKEETLVVDVSSVADYHKGHILDAQHIPLSRFNTPDAEIEKLKDKPVLLVCKTGQTAQTAASALVKLGAQQVAVLKGGMAQWAADQYPIVKG